MTDWKVGHYAVGLRDGGSEWHIGTKIHRECKHDECIALFKEERKLAALRAALERIAAMGSNEAANYAAAEARVALKELL